MTRLPKLVLIFLLTFLVISCTIRRVGTNPEGQLQIFGSDTPITNILLPKEWFIDGISETSFLLSHLNLVSIDGLPALNLMSGLKGYVFAKRTTASLLATPFLRWSWNVPAFSGKIYPLGLIIGFYGSNTKSLNWGDQIMIYLGAKRPLFDRAISLIWHQNALLRGTVNKHSKLPRYVARGGIENTDKWHVENIDLAALYHSIWPNDDMSKTQIVFVGFAATPGTNSKNITVGAAFADVVLSK
jgi:hypothetical protein